jgi:hypothetical protein
MLEGEGDAFWSKITKSHEGNSLNQKAKNHYLTEASPAKLMLKGKDVTFWSKIAKSHEGESNGEDSKGTQHANTKHLIDLHLRLQALALQGIPYV